MLTARHQKCEADHTWIEARPVSDRKTTPMTLRRKLATLVAVAVLVSTNSAYSQSSFLKHKQSGIGLSGFILSGEEFTGLGAAFGYSFESRFDLGLVVSRTGFEDGVIGNDGNSISLSPYATATLVKPSRSSVFGAELSASYGYATYDSDDLARQRLDLSENGINIGIILYTRHETSPTLDVFPRAGVAYVNVRQKLANSTGQSETADFEDVGFLLGFDFLFNDKVTVSPEFNTIDGNNSYRIGVGLILPN